MVRCKLWYCCLLWSPTNVTYIAQVENIQSAFTRVILGVDSLITGRDSKRLNSCRYRKEESDIWSFTWKIINNQAPNSTNMTFRDNLRLGRKAVIPTLNKRAQKSVQSRLENSFGIRAAQLWNSLPKDIHEERTLNTFKAKLGRYLDSFPNTSYWIEVTMLQLLEAEKV